MAKTVDTINNTNDHANISFKDVEHLADLAMLDMSPAEMQKMQGELDVILTAIKKVQEVAKDDVPVSRNPIELVNVLRDDIEIEGLTQEEALFNAPAQQNGEFKIAKVMDEEQ
jgi:aspartyl-tRNA(Asn)/glutamyl-tRNA(Gln) amidotransferase subunit C